MVFSVMIVPGTSALGAQQATTTDIGDVTDQTEDGNILIFQVGGQEVRVELCTPRTVRVQLSLDGPDGYRPEDPQYYMVQKNEWDPVEKNRDRRGWCGKDPHIRNGNPRTEEPASHRYV